MKVLEFTSQAVRVGTKRVRAARFGERSNLPLSAASLVANAFRETLASVLGIPVSVRLYEPSVPPPSAWVSIAAGAALYRVAGTTNDAAIVLRPPDALALATAAFGERATGERPLSELESQVVARIVRALAAQLAPVCGARDALEPAPLGHLSGYVTYFEIDAALPDRARIGVALSRDPVPAQVGHVPERALDDVPIELAAHIASRPVAAAVVASLRPGDVLPLDGLRAALVASGTAIGYGEVGTQNGQYAFAFRHRTAQETT